MWKVAEEHFHRGRVARNLWRKVARGLAALIVGYVCQVDTGKNAAMPSLNELEWIDGKIFANIYQRNGVAIINPNAFLLL